jgi:hypothetical protein
MRYASITMHVLISSVRFHRARRTRALVLQKSNELRRQQFHERPARFSALKSTGFDVRSRQETVPLDEVLVIVSVREANSRDSNRFKDSGTSELIGNHRRLEAVRHKLIIRFQTADVVGLRGFDANPKCFQLRAELNSHSIAKEGAARAMQLPLRTS